MKTLTSPFRHSRPAPIHISPLAEFDGSDAVTALQARFSLRGNDPVHALHRVLSLALVSADGKRVRVLRGRLQRTPNSGFLHLFDEDGRVLTTGILETQVVGWSACEPEELEASCLKRLEALEQEINANFLTALLHLSESHEALQVAATASHPSERWVQAA